MKKFIYLGAAAIMAVFTSCADKDPIVAQIGKETIRASEVRERLMSMDYNGSEMGHGAVKDCIDEMVREAVMIELAKRDGLDKTEAFKNSLASFKRDQERQFNEYRDSMLIEQSFAEFQKEVSISDQEIEAYYNVHKEDFDAPVAYTVRHILVYDIDTANTVYDELKRGGSFETLAVEYSQDAVSASNGGLIGPFKKGEVIPEFENVALALAPGQMSSIIETPLGYHIIYKVSQTRMPPDTYEQVQDDIRRILEQEKFNMWYESKKQELKIKVNYSVPID
jgi:parvulin-like peptidyl-prolyl isomerase